MKSFRKIICMVCICSIISVMILPTLIHTLAGNGLDKEVTLADGSKWLFDADSAYNTLNTDSNGRYTIDTTASGTANSGFKLLSNGLYPMSTKFNLRIQEASNAETYFGLTDEYTTELNYENSIRFIRKNGYNGSENSVGIYVKVNGNNELIFSKFGYTRTRVSQIGVTKKNGSWYMTWNGQVLDGADKSAAVQEYCKLENHFAMELLETNTSFHFYAGATALLNKDAFLFQAEGFFDKESFITAADSYGDRNNPTTVTKSLAPTVSKNENSKYTYTFSSNSTTAALMAPVTIIDSETGKSPEFNMEHFINVNDGNRYWMSYSLSNDPTFTDGTEISFKSARLGDMGQAVHFLTMANVTMFGANGNFYNDPANSSRYFWFEKDKEKGEIYLYFWGSNLIGKASPHCVKIDFSSLVGKPIYIRVTAQSLGSAKISVDITPYNSTEVNSAIAAIEEKAVKVPQNLSEAEEIIAEYDSNAYRFAVSANAISQIIKTRAYLIEEREKALQVELADIRARINAMPEKSDFQSNYSSIVAEDIKKTYIDYYSLGENKSKLDNTYVEKLEALIDVVVNHSDYSEGKAVLDDLNNKITALGAVTDLTVYNYTEKNQGYIELMAVYNSLDELQVAIVGEQIKLFVENYAEALNAVKDAGEVVALINNLPSPENIKYADLNQIIAAKTAYNNLSDKTLIDAQLLAKLNACETAIEDAKINELDWYAPNNLVTYTGSNKDGYVFSDTRNKVNGYIFATTTDKYNMVTDELYWSAPSCGSGQFMMLVFTNNVKGATVTNNSADTITFILRPSGSGVSFTFFDVNGESERIAVINGFDLGGMHKFSTVKGEDGHWYLVVDGQVCDAFNYSRFDNYMEQYGASTHIAIGGVHGFSANNVAILNKEDAGKVGDWAFSIPFGCSYEGDSLGYNIKLGGGAKAVWQKKLEDLAGWSFNVNMNSQLKSSWTYIGLLASPDVTLSDASGTNGVVIALANRPAAGDYRTHILAHLGGKWVTLTAKEPSIIDADYFTLSVTKEADRHFYLKITWANGNYVAKLDRNNQFYRNLQLDTLLEKGAYLMVRGTEIDIENHYAPYVEEEEELDSKPAVEFILEFEKRFEKLKKYSKADYEYLVKMWNNLDFYNRNSVLADFMVDEMAYNMLLLIKDYNEGDLDEYYYESETVEVLRSELDSFIKEYPKEEGSEYTFSYSDGTVIAVSKPLEIPVDVSDSKGSKNLGLTILLGAVFGGAVGIVGLRKKRLYR